MPKNTLRQTLNRQRRQLDETVRNRCDLAAQQRLLCEEVFAAASVIALYAPCRGEVDTSRLFAAARSAGKLVAYPRVAGDHLSFVPVDTLAALQVGAFGIPEPASGSELPVSSLELILVPGVGFGRDGHRLGSGFGYYDRTLAAQGRPKALVGFAYDFQLVNTLPVEPHDVQLDQLVTDARTLVFAPSINER